MQRASSGVSAGCLGAGSIRPGDAGTVQPHRLTVQLQLLPSHSELGPATPRPLGGAQAHPQPQDRQAWRLTRPRRSCTGRWPWSAPPAAARQQRGPSAPPTPAGPASQLHLAGLTTGHEADGCQGSGAHLDVPLVPEAGVPLQCAGHGLMSACVQSDTLLWRGRHHCCDTVPGLAKVCMGFDGRSAVTALHTCTNPAIQHAGSTVSDCRCQAQGRQRWPASSGDAEGLHPVGPAGPCTSELMPPSTWGLESSYDPPA